MRGTRNVLLMTAVAVLLSAPVALAEGMEMLTLQFTNLMPLDESSDGLYEGWAIIDGMPVSTGVFNVNSMGEPVEPGTGTVIESFSVDANLADATDIKISLEPAGDMDPAPSGLIVVEGSLSDTTAQLEAAVPGLDQLPMAMASYILATPSDNDMHPDNDDMGVWYLTMPGPMAGLTGLPDLGANWIYEGWAVDMSGASPMAYSTGTFTLGEGFDSDMAGCMGGGPAFPGQDFVSYHCGPELDLDSGDFALVISIEPVPDNSPAPFQFKPLAGMVPTDALDGANSLDNQTAATFPSGVATISGVTPVSTTSWDGLKASYR